MMQKRLLPACLLLAAAALLGCLAFWADREAKKDSTGYLPDLSSEYLVTQYADESGRQGTFYTISNENCLIVVDGGWAENEAAVRRVIASHGNVVDAWIISHPHQDHAGAFNAICAAPEGITIRQIYDNGFDYEFIRSVGEPYDDINVMETYYALTQNADNVTHLARGDVLTVCGLTLTVYNAFDQTVLDTVGDEKDYQNNASLLFELSGEQTGMLFCSDIKYDMDAWISEHYGDQIRCDYVQTGHHGNWSFSDAFYEKTGASVYFLDAPAEITEGDFPARQLKESLLGQNKTVLDFSTAPNTITLR